MYFLNESFRPRFRFFFFFFYLLLAIFCLVLTPILLGKKRPNGKESESKVVVVVRSFSIRWIALARRLLLAPLLVLSIPSFNMCVCVCVCGVILVARVRAESTRNPFFFLNIFSNQLSPYRTHLVMQIDFNLIG